MLQPCSSRTEICSARTHVSTSFRLPSLEFGVSLSLHRHGRTIPPLGVVGGCFGPRTHRVALARSTSAYERRVSRPGYGRKVSLSLSPSPEQLEQLHNGPGIPFARLSRNKLRVTLKLMIVPHRRRFHCCRQRARECIQDKQGVEGSGWGTRGTVG
jgi:hypothetical protein